MSEPAQNITVLLHRIRDGSREAEDQLINLVYSNLKRMAYSCMRGERGNHTLQPTALLHETWMKIVHDADIDWQDRSHFFALASRAMRRILVEYARSQTAIKRGGMRNQVDLTEGLLVSEDNLDKVLIVDEALEELSHLDARQAQIVELRYFGGLTEDEISAAIGVATRTVKRDWKMARAWLSTKMAHKGLH